MRQTLPGGAPGAIRIRRRPQGYRRDGVPAWVRKTFGWFPKRFLRQATPAFARGPQADWRVAERWALGVRESRAPLRSNHGTARPAAKHPCCSFGDAKTEFVPVANKEGPTAEARPDEEHLTCGRS